jgi:AcrR family transcriptional regulator
VYSVDVSSKSTKQRLLEAAAGAFALQGYEAARVADICDCAGANVAGINYHFGSKEALLREVIRHAFELAEAGYPIRGMLSSDASPEERLRAFMTAMIRRCFDPGPAGQFDRIMSRLSTNMDGPTDVIISEVTRLQGNLLDEILTQLLGEVSETHLKQARFNFIALCVFPSIVPRLPAMLFPDAVTQGALDRYIERQIQFALAGIRAMRPLSNP